MRVTSSVQSKWERKRGRERERERERVKSNLGTRKNYVLERYTNRDK